MACFTIGFGLDTLAKEWPRDGFNAVAADPPSGAACAIAFLADEAELATPMALVTPGRSSSVPTSTHLSPGTPIDTLWRPA
jgi:hypothetical protein